MLELRSRGERREEKEVERREEKEGDKEREGKRKSKKGRESEHTGRLLFSASFSALKFRFSKITVPTGGGDSSAPTYRRGQ